MVNHTENRGEREGQQLGNYRLIRLLGQGGFAKVYLGEHLYLKTQAALKVLQVRLGNDALQDFLNEAQAIARLEHPNIVRVLECGVEDHTPFLVMNYAPNGTLRQRYPKGSHQPLEVVLLYVQQIALALDYAHQERLIHRDIKPENMLVGRGNEVLLSDFGLVVLAQSSGSQTMREMAGTIPYMAPEQLQGRPCPASDQYSLGIVVYEWLSGERPFQGTFSEIASQQLLASPPRLYGRIPGVTPAIEHVVFRALAKGPQQRFATVQAFATALEQASQAVQPDALVAFNTLSPSGEPAQSTYVKPSHLISRSDQFPPSVYEVSPLSLSSQSAGMNRPSNRLSLTNAMSTPSGQLSQPTHVISPSSQYAQIPTILPPLNQPPQSIDPPIPPGQPFTPTVMASNRPQSSKRRVSRRTVLVGMIGLVAAGTATTTTYLFLSQKRQTVVPPVSPGTSSPDATHSNSFPSGSPTPGHPGTFPSSSPTPGHPGTFPSSSPIPTYSSSSTPTQTGSTSVPPSGTPIPTYSGSQRYVMHLYHDILGRPPTQSELNSGSQALDQGSPRAQLVNALLSGQEYFTNLVTADYQQVLHRPPDTTGLGAAVGWLQNGKKNEDVLVALAASDEYFNNRGGGTNSGFASALYEDLLRRAGSQAEINALVQALNNGATRQQAANNFVTSQEYRTNLVVGYFMHYLGRAPNSGEENSAISILNQGNPDEAVIGDIVTSDEYYAKT